MIPSLTETPSGALFIMPKGRRRLAPIALGVIACAGALLPWLWEREDAHAVKLVFLGYTNEIIQDYRLETPPGRSWVWVQKALVGITNSGDKSVLPASRLQVGRRLGPGQYVDTTLSPLAPGEMKVTTVFVPKADASWEAEFAYFQFGMMEQWISRARASKRFPFTTIATLLPGPKLQWAEGIWITNRPARKRFHIEAPLPPFIFEPPLKDTNTLAN